MKSCMNMQKLWMCNNEFAITKWIAVWTCINMDLQFHELSKWFSNASIHSCIQSCFHSCIHACIHWFIRAFIRVLIRAFIRAFICACVHSFVHSFVHACIHSRTHLCLHSCIHLCMRAFIRAFLELTLDHNNKYELLTSSANKHVFQMPLLQRWYLLQSDLLHKTIQRNIYFEWNASTDLKMINRCAKWKANPSDASCCNRKTATCCKAKDAGKDNVCTAPIARTMVAHGLGFATTQNETNTLRYSTNVHNSVIGENIATTVHTLSTV